jgi:hypothetical protein
LLRSSDGAHEARQPTAAAIRSSLPTPTLDMDIRLSWIEWVARELLAKYLLAFGFALALT